METAPAAHDLEAALTSAARDLEAAMPSAPAAYAAVAAAVAALEVARDREAAHDLEAAVPAAAEAVAALAAALEATRELELEAALPAAPAAAAAEVAAAARELESALALASEGAAALTTAKSKAAKKAEQKKVPAAKKVAEEEDPRLRWAFVRKVYAILSLQFALTAAVAATACLVRPIPRFFVHGPRAAVWPTYIVILVSPLIVMFPMLKYREKHPTNLVLLALFTLCCSLSIAMSASITLGTVVLQATILTAASVVGLTLFTFWAVKKGFDFTFTGPFLFTCLHVLLVYLIIQLFFPLGRVGMTVYGFLATLVFSGFVVYDTSRLLKRHTYNEYVVAAISLYLDVINLFMAQMSISCN